MSEVVVERLAPRVINTVTGKSRTEKAHKNRVNINSIIRKAQRTGLIPTSSNPGFYGDFTGVSDYQSCVNALINAEDRFMALPSSVRKEFDNDPSKLIDFLSKEENREKAIELGILEKEIVAAPVEPPVVPDGGE